MDNAKNRIERYLPGSAGKKHVGVIASAVNRQGSGLSDILINNMSRNPDRFDRDVAAIYDLIEENNGNVAEQKKYKDLLAKVVGRNFPGVMVTPRGEKRAMEAVGKMARPSSMKITQTGDKIAAAKAMKRSDDVMLAQFYRANRNARGSAAGRTMAVNELADMFIGSGKKSGIDRATVSKAHAVVSDLSALRHIDYLTETFGNTAFKEALSWGSDGGKRPLMISEISSSDHSRISRLLSDLDTQRSLVISNGKINPDVVARMSKISETLMSDDVKPLFESYVGQSARNAARGYSDGASIISGQFDYVRNAAIENMDIGSLRTPNDAPDFSEVISGIKSEEGDLARAQRFGRKYAQMGRLIEQQNHGDILSMLIKYQLKIGAEFRASLPSDQQQYARRILRHFDDTGSNIASTTDAGAVWARMANRFHGGVQLRDSGDAITSLVERDFVRARGNIIGVHGRRAMVSIGGFTSLDTSKINISMEHLAGMTSGFTDAPGEGLYLDGEIRRMSALNKLNAAEKQNAKTVANAIASRIYKAFSVGEQQSSLMTQSVDLLGGRSKSIMSMAMELMKGGTAPSEILNKLQAKGYSSLEIVAAISESTEIALRSKPGQAAWFLRKSLDVITTMGDIADTKMTGLEEIVDPATHAAMESKAPKATMELLNSLKESMANQNTRLKRTNLKAISLGRALDAIDPHAITDSTDLQTLIGASKKFMFGENADVNMNQLGKLLDGIVEMRDGKMIVLDQDGLQEAMTRIAIAAKQGDTLDFGSHAGSVKSQTMQTTSQQQKKLHAAIDEANEVIKDSLPKNMRGDFLRKDADILARLRRAVADGDLDVRAFDAWITAVTSKVSGRLSSGSDSMIDLERAIGNFSSIDVDGRSIAAAASLDAKVRGKDGEMHLIKDFLADKNGTGRPGSGSAMHTENVERIAYEVEEAHRMGTLGEFAHKIDVLSDEATRLQMMKLTDEQKQQKNLYVLSNLYDRMLRQTATGRASLSEDFARGAHIEGLDDLSFNVVGVSSADNELLSQTFKPMMHISGTNRRTLERESFLLEQVKVTAKDGSEHMQMRSLSAEEAASMRVVKNVDVRSMKFAVDGTRSIELVNQALAVRGLDEKDFMDAAKQLLPGLHAEATIDDVIKASRHMTDVDPMLNDISLASWVGDSGGEAASRQSVNIVDAIGEAADTLRGGGTISSEMQASVAHVTEMMNSSISGSRAGGMSKDFMETTKNMKTAIGIDVLEEFKKLGSIRQNAPMASSIAIAGITLAGLAAAHRANETQPNRTEEFLQYDHAGSAGITRITPLGEGYDRQSAPRATPSAVTGPTMSSGFKGYKSTVTVTDNIDGMSANAVNRMR